LDLTDDKELMAKVYLEYPREEEYEFEYYDGKHRCERRVIYCDGNRDIVRCEDCGNEREVRCNF